MHNDDQSVPHERKIYISLNSLLSIIYVVDGIRGVPNTVDESMHITKRSWITFQWAMLMSTRISILKFKYKSHTHTHTLYYKAQNLERGVFVNPVNVAGVSSVSACCKFSSSKQCEATPRDKAVSNKHASRTRRTATTGRGETSTMPSPHERNRNMSISAHSPSVRRLCEKL